mgnify:FL=1
MEHKSQPLALRKILINRMISTIAYALIILGFALALGILGYHFIADLAWIDALYNASMILGGMGPVDPLTTDGAKIFASVYAISSGVILIGLFGLVLTPVFHRIMHRLHLQEK